MELFNTGLKIVSVANITKPDPDNVFVVGASSGYDRIRVFDTLDDLASITIVNFGPSDLYVIYTENRVEWLNEEIYLPGPTINRDYVWIKLDKVYEARVRSPNAANQYMAFKGSYG